MENTENQVFTYPLKINESHLDTFGHVNNATYVQLFEQARWEFITNNNMGLEVVQSSGVGPIILEFTIKYLKEVNNRENVQIKSWCSEHRGSRIIIDQILYNEAGVEACKASFLCALFDTKKRRLVTPSNEWLQAVGVNVQ